jgi:hypothetical protein
MNRYSYAFVAVGLISAAIPLRAANRPHAGADSQTMKTWTNHDLEKLRHPDLISIVTHGDQEQPKPAPVVAGYVKAQDPEWYTEQGASLRDELQYRQAQLREYRRALVDARNLTDSPGGIDLVGENVATTSDAGIEILQQRVVEAQAKPDGLEELPAIATSSQAQCADNEPCSAIEPRLGILP